jgi:hypothetical protein
MQGLIGTLLAALSPFPEARQAAAQALIEGGWASDPDAPAQPLTPLSAPEQPAAAGCATEAVAEERAHEAVSLPEKASPEASKPAPAAAERADARPAAGLQPGRIETAFKVHPADMETKAFGLPRRPAASQEPSPWGFLGAGYWGEFSFPCCTWPADVPQPRPARHEGGCLHRPDTVAQTEAVLTPERTGIYDNVD